MLDPVVHAALITVFAWLVQWLFTSIGLDLGGEVYTALAEFIVAYILSLFGLGLLRKANIKGVLGADSTYKPPFT